jgi:hypothetical protein
MPELARFFGIVVVMLYRDYAPLISMLSMAKMSGASAFSLSGS